MDDRERIMKVRLLWVQRDFRGNELNRREEILQGESTKSPTRNYVARLIARHHPELVSVDRVHLLDAHETDCKWYVRSYRVNSNCWETAYAEPLEENEDAA